MWQRYLNFKVTKLLITVRDPGWVLAPYTKSEIYAWWIFRRLTWQYKWKVVCHETWLHTVEDSSVVHGWGSYLKWYEFNSQHPETSTLCTKLLKILHKISCKFWIMVQVQTNASHVRLGSISNILFRVQKYSKLWKEIKSKQLSSVAFWVRSKGPGTEGCPAKELKLHDVQFYSFQSDWFILTLCVWVFRLHVCTSTACVWCQ